MQLLWLPPLGWHTQPLGCPAESSLSQTGFSWQVHGAQLLLVLHFLLWNGAAGALLRRQRCSAGDSCSALGQRSGAAF